MSAHIKYFDIGPYPAWFGFTTSKKAFYKELKRLGIDEMPEFVTSSEDATTHVMEKKGELKNIIVAMRKPKKREDDQVMGLLVHEAVHVWQEILTYINEKNPGDEISAYAIQYIAQCMIREVTK